MMDAGATKPDMRASEIMSNLARFRGLASHDLPAGHILCDDVYLAVPLQKGQISCRELMHGDVVAGPVAADAPVRIDDIDSPYSSNDALKALIYSRGL